MAAPSFVEAAGHRLEYIDHPARDANRPTLLLLHEGLGSVSVWRDFPLRLHERTGARTVAYSRAGFGRSAARTLPFTKQFMHEEAYEVLPELRERLGIVSPALVGHSTGASMAMIHAAAADVSGVVALAPFAFVEDSNVEAIRAAGKRYDEIRGRLARHHDDVDAMFEAWQRLWLDPAFREWNIEAEIARLRVPVLAILGDRDEYCTPVQLDRIRARAAHARYEELRLAGVGHAPHRNAPEAILDAVARFLDTLET
jgi:pimeloyl-ACP methyl ester carboxylesterase